MNTIEAIRGFFAWCSVINIGVLIFLSILMVSLRGITSRIHAKMFGLEESDISRAYFQFLAQYKIFVIVFSIVPYFALRIMA